MAPSPPPAPRRDASSPGGDALPPLGRRDAGLALGLAAALAALYLGPSELLPGQDATGSVYTAASLLTHGRLTLTPSQVPVLFGWEDRRAGQRTHRLPDLSARVDGVPAADLIAAGQLVAVPPYFLARVAGDAPGAEEPRFVSGFGPGAPLLALPVLAPLHLWAGDLLRRPALLWAGARTAAALQVAAAAALLFLAARRWLRRRPAAALALLFGLGTPAWSLASQTLWQHPGDLFCLSLGALALTRVRGPGPAPALAGFAFAAAAACRPQSALFAVVVLAWLLLQDRRAAVAFAAGALAPALGLAAWNGWYLGGPLRFGQVEVSRAIALSKTGVADPWPFRLHESLPGLLVSPSRGLLVFSPFLALAILGAARAFRQAEHRALRPLAVAAALLLVVEAGWFDWWGGWSYGWRRLLGLAPALSLLLVPVVPWLAASRWRGAAFGVLAAWAVAVQGLGALAYDLSGWNARQAWRVVQPSGEEALLVDAAAASAAVARGGAVRQVLYLDVDEPAWRPRLWSIRDSQIVHTASQFGRLRRARHQGAAAWVASFAPTESSGVRP